MTTAIPAAVALHPGDASETDRIATIVQYTPLIGVTILSKFCYLVAGSEILFGVPLILVAVLAGIFTGRLKPEPMRMAGYLLLLATLLAEQVFAVKTFVANSLILLLAVPFSYAFQMDARQKPAERHMHWFLNLAFIVCLLGLAQYALQFVIGVKYAYPIEHFAPKQFLTTQYNQLIPLKYGHSVYKANGVILLEPSYFSQMLGLGFALEAFGPRRLFRLACMLGGFVVAYSGTGLLLMTITMTVMIFKYRRFELLIGGAVAFALVLAFAEPLGLKIFTDRLTEFKSTNSSGYMRYVGGFHLFNQYLWKDPVRALFGLGSGMMFRTTPWPEYSVSGTGWVKMMVEFGLVGFCAYFGFLFWCAFRARQPLALRVGVAVTMLLNGILDPWSHGLMLTLLLWLPPMDNVDSLMPKKRVPTVAGQAELLPRSQAIVPVRGRAPEWNNPRYQEPGRWNR